MTELRPSAAIPEVKALAFDVFGTVVDWRGSVIRDGEALTKRTGVKVDWGAFADAWRGEYAPSMRPIRDGERSFVNLDVLHWENLLTTVDRLKVEGLSEEDLRWLNLSWHRLDPWPDAAEGIARLERKYVVVTLSNGNVALTVDLIRHGRLPFDAVLGAEVARQYKPHPQAYLTTVSLLQLEPSQVMMVAAHNSDLRGATRAGLRSAFVVRPTQYGPGVNKDLSPEDDWDVVAKDFLDLAERLGT
ncbi:MAG: haloacid dehalogenase type II [Myxococcales bacterium]